MRQSAFEQAAVEARGVIRELDSEIERLNAKKESLEAKRELLETLGRQLLAVLPMSIEANAADRDNQAGASSNEPEAEQPSAAHGVQEDSSDSVTQDAWSSFISASPLRGGARPTSSPVNGRGIREVLL
jgi:hypothetical protein